MPVRVSVLANKYAIAFLNLFFPKISDEFIDKLVSLESFFKKNRLFYVYLRIPSLSYLVKKKALDLLCSEFELDNSVIRLMYLLLDQGRIEIIDKVLGKIVTFYRCRKNIELFNVTSSHALSDSEKEKVTKFIKHVAEKKVLADFIVDRNLIAGLRIQSSSFLWERSIAKQLRDVKRSIFKQVGLW